MDAVERLTVEASQADTVLACEHRQRYEFAARLCAGRRVLDLGCGSGYGSAILAAQALEVLGVDRDSRAIEVASASLATHVPRLGFEQARTSCGARRTSGSASTWSSASRSSSTLMTSTATFALLRLLAEDGIQLILSVPNAGCSVWSTRTTSRASASARPRRLLDAPGRHRAPQYLAEGSVICPPGARAAEVAIVMDDRDELEYANTFICCSGFEPDAVNAVHRGGLQVAASPVYNRWAEGLKHAISSLEAENARLARGWLGRSGAAQPRRSQPERRAGRRRMTRSQCRRLQPELEALRDENLRLRQENAELQEAALLFARKLDGRGR